MSKYASILYGGGIYGESPKLGYSVEPMSLYIDSFTATTVSWESPSGEFSRIRVVRNQSGFPETSEDGIIIFEQSSMDGTPIGGLVTTNYIRDGIDNPTQIPVISGREVYYRVFLFSTDKVWITAGSIHGVIPLDTGVTKKMLDLLPRVLTSQELSPLGTIDESSDLYRFLDGLAFTYEQLLTSIDLIRPGHATDKAVYLTIPGEDLHLGLTMLHNFPVVNQRRLIREALYLYSKRGTKVGLEGYAESLTGYIPTATLSPNLLLSVQDSTFYNSTGNWVFESATAEASGAQAPAAGANVIDGAFTCEVTASDSFYMVLGYVTPKTDGVPVTANTEYTVSCKIKSPTSAGNILLTVAWYDKDGALISEDSSSIVAANNTWKTGSVTATSPADAVYAGLKISSDALGVYYIDQVCFQLGASVDYYEARSVDLHLLAKKQNYIHNPSFEVDDSTWALTGLDPFEQSTSVPYDGYSGAYSGKFVASGSWTIQPTYPIPVDIGFYVSLSMYVKSADLTSMDMDIQVYDADDVLLYTISGSHEVTADWTRGSISGLIPSDSGSSYANVVFSGGAGTFYLDMIQFEDTSESTDYFDGSMPSNFGVIWEGASNASNSFLYPSKPIKMSRLAHTMKEWVPSNTWWRLTTPAGVEYDNLDV